MKTAIFGGNSKRVYGYERAGRDRFDTLEADYVNAGGLRTNLRYGYVQG